jgi:hypothetical protein
MVRAAVLVLITILAIFAFAVLTARFGLPWTP